MQYFLERKTSVKTPQTFCGEFGNVSSRKGEINMNKSNSTGTIRTGMMSLAMCSLLAMIFLPATTVNAVPTPNCNGGGLTAIVGVSPSVAHVGDTINISRLGWQIKGDVCGVSNVTAFVVYPSGSNSMTLYYTNSIHPTDKILPDSTFDCIGGTNTPSTNCVPVTSTYVVQPDDVGRRLDWTSPRGEVFIVLPLPGYIQLDAGAIGKTLPTGPGQASQLEGGDAPQAVLIVTPGIDVSKQCSSSPFVYGQPIQFSGTITNTGNDDLANVGVVDTPSATITYDTTTYLGNPFNSDGSAPFNILVEGDSVGYSGTYSPPGSGSELCGPFPDTIVASGTENGNLNGQQTDLANLTTVLATNQASCTVTSSPCITVTKTCPQSIVYGTTNYVIGGGVTNCGNVPLVNVQIVDDNGTPGDPSDDITIVIGGLDIGQGVVYSATNTVPVSCGPFTDTVLATGTGVCGGAVSSTNNCTTTVTTSPCISVTKTCPTSPLAPGTTSYPVSGVVSNCGNVPLTGVIVVDDNGTPGNPSDDTTNFIGTLGVGAFSTWQATNTVPNPVPASITDTAKATGFDGCTQQKVTDSAQCTTSNSVPHPKICVGKEIACKQVGLDCSDPSYNYGKFAVGMDGTNNSAFCYQIIVTNCGEETLTNVNLIDNKLGALNGFPTVLLPGQIWTNYYSQSYGLGSGGKPSTNVNTVIATGTGLTSGIVTNAQSSATNVVLPLKVSCNIVLFSTYDMDGNTNDNHVLLPQNNTNTPITFTLNICNPGMVDLDVTVTGLPSLVDCGGDIQPQGVLQTIFVPTGQCAQVTGCVLVPCGTTNFNVTVQGTANPGETGDCIYDSFGNVISSAPSSCSAKVECQQPVSCRVTGGGTLQPGNVDQDCAEVDTTFYDSFTSTPVDHISHGGQLGAPFSQQDCGEILGNPCIRGEWEHNRHYVDGSADAVTVSFHSANPQGQYDTLMCACLGCCGPTVNQPKGQFLGVAKKFTLCNPDDHRVCGPMPSPAPANAIIFTGIGTFHPGAKGHGKSPSGGTTYMVFRVYIEDRSEGGGNHPKGANEPADVYCFQAWDTGYPVGKKTDFSNVAVKFRQDLAADSCAFIKSIATPSQVVNGVVVGGPGVLLPGTLPDTIVDGAPADIIDQGPVWGGNQQIHPSTSATCSN
jgi:uncharacterized repeat protein (TIGR01451 family)